jgi:uncharacterized membrane protein YkoI
MRKRLRRKRQRQETEASEAAARADAKAVKQSLPPGTEISERQATSIAMDAAPASSGFTSSRQTYQGKPVYVVTFKTDEGPYDVLVDAASGAVVVSAYVETHDAKADRAGAFAGRLGTI